MAARRTTTRLSGWIIRSWEYQHYNEWLIDAEPSEVARLILDVQSIERWWSSSFLGVKLLDAGDADGVGRQFAATLKGWLPYRVRLQLAYENVRYPLEFDVTTAGDLVGDGTIRIEPKLDQLLIRFQWKARVQRPLLKVLSPFCRAVLLTNHAWIMHFGRRRMIREIERGRMRPRLGGVGSVAATCP